MNRGNDAATSFMVSPEFSALVRKHELSLATEARHAEVTQQLDDDIMRPLLDEQLRECVFKFSRLTPPPSDRRIVSEQGLNPALAHTLFADIPVLPQDRQEAEQLACNEFRRLAKMSDQNIPGAALTLRPNGEVTLRPL